MGSLKMILQQIREWPVKKKLFRIMSFVFIPVGLLAGFLPGVMRSDRTPEALSIPSDTSLVPVYPTNYFRSPLDIPLNLSGNFGELRTNHFHAGIDIKTLQREGLNVYAPADGYVSRIKVSPVGYGYALYIDHPNGYTTVYGHLQKYSSRIDAFVKKEQYAQKKFAVDVFPTPGDLPVTSGEIIALSGNTGGSGGPHLHFEIRETATEKPINPLLFGFDIKDNIAPSVSSVWIVPMSDSSWVNGARVPVSLETKSNGRAYGLKSTTLPTIYGDVGFAIVTSDALDGNANRCGIYRIELYVDSLLVYGQRMDRLDFTTNRAMNAHTIYERFKKNRSQLHGSYRLPGNPLDIYDNLVNDGIVTIRDGKKHLVEYKIIDLSGNSAVVKFQVQGQSSAKEKPASSRKALARFNWEEDNVYEGEKVKVKIPAYALYEDADMTLEERPKMAGAITPTYLIMSPYEPIHEACTISVKAEVKERYRNKVVLMRWDPDKDKTTAEGGVYENGWVTGTPMYLGYYSVMIDTVAPSISSLDFSATMKGRSSFSFKISDAMSGISEYYPEIDGSWVLMEYDAKNNKITCYFDPERMSRGKHLFRIAVRDAVGNEKVYESKFEW